MAGIYNNVIQIVVELIHKFEHVVPIMSSNRIYFLYIESALEL